VNYIIAIDIFCDEGAPLQQLITQHLAGALLASARSWILQGKTQSAGEMAYWFSAMAAPGLYQLMGLDDLLKDES